MKIVSFNGQYRITLPKDLIKDKGWDSGTELRFVEDDRGRIFLRPIATDKTSQRKEGGRA